MKQNHEHTTLTGTVVSLKGLDTAEQALLKELRSFLKKTQDWNLYSNFWLKKVGNFYEQRGLSRSQVIQKPVFRVGQDMGSRLAVEQGLARAPNPKPDYREQLARIVREKYRTQRAFCQAAGIAEDLLSHVLAGRKHLAIDTLATALERVGYQLQISPLEKEG